jgi:BirA family transcriptional regulator, biotin operon repressor / biotin---[acetyl-CoA-carboxylase] ligase
MQNPYLAIQHGEPGTIGWRIYYYDEVTSTQDVARHWALDGAAHGTVVVAEAQSHGHGRLGRKWFSPFGVNLHTSRLLKNPQNSVVYISP